MNSAAPRAAALAALLAFAQSVAAQESGVVAAPPPVDVVLEVTTGPNGEPVLSTDELRGVLGGYYRFNFVCPEESLNDDTGFHLEVEDLLANAHLRVVSIGDIEIYMQGMSFRALECDEAGSARFSFHPMRRGTYEIYVRDHSEPPQEARGRFVVE